MEGLKVSEANLTVYVHPSKAKSVSDAIRRELSSLLFKFSETFEGVVLAYPSVDFCREGEGAKILPGINPYFGVRLKAQLLLFQPQPNMLLEGKVVKLSKQAIHVIVLGFSSAIITEEEIREEFRYKSKRGEEVFASKSHKRHKIKVGSFLRFTVKRFDEEIIHITGSLLPAHTGCVRWLEKNVEDGSHIDRSTKKRKESEGRGEMREMVDVATLPMNSGHRNKKIKRRKSGEDSLISHTH